jgi:hypothetical protein
MASIKHIGDFIVVLGYFGGTTLSSIFRISGIMKKNDCRDVLQRQMLPSGKRIFHLKKCFLARQ